MCMLKHSNIKNRWLLYYSVFLVPVKICFNVILIHFHLFHFHTWHCINRKVVHNFYFNQLLSKGIHRSQHLETDFRNVLDYTRKSQDTFSSLYISLNAMSHISLGFYLTIRYLNSFTSRRTREVKRVWPLGTQGDPSLTLCLDCKLFPCELGLS